MSLTLEEKESSNWHTENTCNNIYKSKTQQKLVDTFFTCSTLATKHTHTDHTHTIITTHTHTIITTHTLACTHTYLTPCSWRKLTNPWRPPGRSLTHTVSLTRRLSAASPRSKQRPSTLVSMLPPDSTTTTLDRRRPEQPQCTWLVLPCPAHLLLRWTGVSNQQVILQTGCEKKWQLILILNYCSCALNTIKVRNIWL